MAKKRKATPLKKPAADNLVGSKVGIERHFGYDSQAQAPVITGHPSKTSEPRPAKPPVGAGKGFTGI